MLTIQISPCFDALRRSAGLRCTATLFAALILSPFAHAQHATPQPPPDWDTFSDTWVAVDGLGRAVPLADEVGPPRADRTLGMFYFLTFDRNQPAVYDNTTILAAHPEAMADIHNPAWGPLNRAHYWGEPLFGYYASDDPAVLRKHAAMLANAGVDVVIFDNSNAVTYDRTRRTLCDTWEAIRRAGGKTPQIAFLCPFGNPAHIGTSTLRELYDTLYGPGLYRDLWFMWNGKPLVMADPGYADPGGFLQVNRAPAALTIGGTLGQTFTTTQPFTAAGGEFPTWAQTDSAMTLTLREGGTPTGRIIAQKRFENVRDNATVLVESDTPLPAGQYYLEMSQPKGQIGWWGYTSDVYAGGEAFEDGATSGGDRSLLVRYVSPGPAAITPGTDLTTLVPDAHPMTPEQAQAQAQKLREFFTFRTPIAPYNLTSPPPDDWAWLQVYPQAPQRDSNGAVEQITVGVGQNYNATVNNTAPMSVQGAFGRSYHDGHRDTRPNAVAYGLNIAEQWKRAREVDPPFVFVTGWNEWTAGFMDSWVHWTAPPPIFVDEFTEEFSRDIEPMRDRKGPDGDGHGDSYYYQFVADARRYKGARPLPPVTPRPIALRGTFAQWNDVAPEFRDAVGDPVHRDWPGVTADRRYVNQTGRNDIVASKVSYDANNVYFLVVTHETLTPSTGDNWMLLLLNTDGNYANGWLGYDFVINRHVGEKTTSLERHVGANGEYRWEKVADLEYRRVGNQLMLAIPRRLLGLTAVRSSPAAYTTTTIDFKWADNCISAQPGWADFTLNGDAAPDDRFNYRAILRDVPQALRRDISPGLGHNDRGGLPGAVLPVSFAR